MARLILKAPYYKPRAKAPAGKTRGGYANYKRIARNIYADSEEECEVKLEALIKEMKAEFGIK